MSAVPDTCPMTGVTHSTVYAHLAAHASHITAWVRAESLGRTRGRDETDETVDAHARCWYATYNRMGLGFCDAVKAEAEHILCCHGMTDLDLKVLVMSARRDPAAALAN